MAKLNHKKTESLAQINKDLSKVSVDSKKVDTIGKSLFQLMEVFSEIK